MPRCRDGPSEKKGGHTGGDDVVRLTTTTRPGRGGWKGGESASGASVQTYSSHANTRSTSHRSSAVVLTSSLAFLPLLIPFFVNRNGILCSLFAADTATSLSLPFSTAPSLFLLFSSSLLPLASYMRSHQPFYTAHQSFLLAFLFSLLAGPPSSRSTHARLPPDYATELL